MPVTIPGRPRHVLHEGVGSILDIGWDPPASGDAAGYEVSLDGATWEDTGSEEPYYRFRGLAPGHAYTVHLRATNQAGAGASVVLDVILPPRPIAEFVSDGQIIPLLDTDRQAVVVRLTGVDCRLAVWWQPSDSAWYATLEVPTGTRLVASRRLATDSAILAGVLSRLPGDIRCRSLSDSRAEPVLGAWGVTHALVYEPD